MKKEKIGKYKIVEEIGKGAMGVVYKALDPDIDREVAIKTIRFEVVSEEVERDELIKRFMKEAQAAGRLAHPNIITIYDVGREEDLTYIVMQYIDGQSLKDSVESVKQFSPYEIIDIITQICDALDYAHQKGIVHRDMKPANILLDKHGKPFIVDFGVARVETSTMTQTGQTLGTPSYMSPEQVMGQKVDGRSDLFSVGVILYELLTGQRPFSAEGGITTLIYRIVNEPPIPISKVKKNVSPKFEPIIAKALAKDPNVRYQNCRELAASLKPLKGVPERTLTLRIKKEELLGEEVAKKKPKLGLVLGIALAAVVIIGGGASYFLVFQKGGKKDIPSGEIQQAKLQDEQKTTTQTPGVLPEKESEKTAEVKETTPEQTKTGTIPPVKQQETKTSTPLEDKTKSTTQPKDQPGLAKPSEDKIKTTVTPPETSKEEKKEAPETNVVTPDPLEGMLKRLKESFSIMENYQETRRIAREILSKDPNNTQAKDYLEKAENKILAAQKVESGVKSFSSGDYSQCVLIMEEVLKLDPQNKSAQQYLTLAKNTSKKAEDSVIRQIIERQRMAEEEKNFELLFSDYTQNLRDKRVDDVRDIFRFYDDITSRVDAESIKIEYPDSTHARVTFHHTLVGVYTSTSQKREIFSGMRTLTFERQGNTWKIIDYK